MIERVLPAMFSLLVAAAGWFYMFYSSAAQQLARIEGQAANQKRIRLRRLGGCSMILLAITFYVGCEALNRHDLALFSGMMLAVLALMAVTLVLALIDLRLTGNLRRSRRQDHSKP
jgi:Na+/H+ antiporter NhaD/arsenite permease-like protein